MTAYINNVSKGCLIEFLQENQPLLGCVLEKRNRQWQVLNINKRTIKLSENRILPWIGPLLPPESSREEILHFLQEHEQARIKLQDKIDPLELWELAQGEIQEVSINWLAELLWETPDIDHTAALGRVLLAYKSHYKFQSPYFKIFSRETVEAKLALEESNRKKEQLHAAGQEFLKALWKKSENISKNKDLLPELPHGLEDELKKILLTGVANPEDNEFKEHWSKLSHELPDLPNLPLILSQIWGILPKHYNYLLDQAGYVWGDDWTYQYQQEILAITEFIARQSPSVEQEDFISIDSSSTRDIDDAFTISKNRDKGYKLKIALACPVLGWDFQSDLDKEVAHRASSLYLPEGSSHMLPEILGTEVFSLHANQSKPALQFEFILDENAELRDIRLNQGWVRLKANLSYLQVENELHKSEPAENLELALELAQKLRQNRIHNGAVILEQNDPQIRLQTDDNQEVQVFLDEANANPLSQLIISEFMVLTNTALSSWAANNDLPLLHRTQDIRLSPDSYGVWKDPVNIFRIMREMASSKLETERRPHVSLGVNGYTPITSPLRRYTDFLNLAQTSSYIHTGSCPWSFDALKAMLPYLNARMEAIQRIQRYRTRYWKLLYIKNWYKVNNWFGVVVADDGQLTTLSLPREKIILRAPRRLFGDKITLGQGFYLRLGKIDPLNNEIKILQAWEEEWN